MGDIGINTFLVKMVKAFHVIGITVPKVLSDFLVNYFGGGVDSLLQFSSIQSLSHVRLFVTPGIAARQASLPSPSPRVHSNSISSSVVPFSSFPQSLPASESFPMIQLFTWGGQSTGVSALASFLPKKSQGWSPLEWTGWIFLQSKGLWRVFSNTTVQKHQFFSAQLSLRSNSHIHTWLLEKS